MFWVDSNFLPPEMKDSGLSTIKKIGTCRKGNCLGQFLDRNRNDKYIFPLFPCLNSTLGT